jgi:hypothetical protein
MRAVASGVVAAGLVAGILLWFGLVNAGNGDAPRSNPDGRVELTQQYPSWFANLWVRGCVSLGESSSYCRCAINVYTTRLRVDEFETVSAVFRGGGQLSELPENLRDAVEDVERECRKAP